MDKHEAGLLSSVAVAIAIGFGQLLEAKRRISTREAIGRAISSAGLGACSGVVLLVDPTIHPLVLVSIGAGFASLGTSVLENIISARLGGGNRS